jgi:hypothetical protein
LAGTEIGQELGNDDRVKLVCARSDSIAPSVRILTGK